MPDRTLPTVSVITPSLNRRNQLKGVIDCVRAQTYPHIEHIVIDGGSSDGTHELLEGHSSTPSLRWLSEPDDGVYSAVNKGLRLAGGEILAYLNTDDRYFDYSIETAVEHFLEHPEAVFVYGDLLRYHLDEDIGELNFYPPFSRGFVQRGHLISQPTVFFRRQLLTTIGYFDESFRLAADIDYWVRSERTGPGRKIDEVLAFETFHQSRLTAGAVSADLAHAELARIASPSRSHGVLGKVLKVRDAARAGFWDRLSRIRFLVSLRFANSARWKRFRDTSFRVQTRSLLLSLVPVFGRTHRLCVYVEARLPWPELEELGGEGDSS